MLTQLRVYRREVTAADMPAGLLGVEWSAIRRRHRMIKIVGRRHQQSTAGFQSIGHVDKKFAIVKNMLGTFQANDNVEIVGQIRDDVEFPNVADDERRPFGIAESSAILGDFLIALVPTDAESVIAEPGRADGERAGAAADIQDSFVVGGHGKSGFEPVPTIEDQRIAVNQCCREAEQTH